MVRSPSSPGDRAALLRPVDDPHDQGKHLLGKREWADLREKSHRLWYYCEKALSLGRMFLKIGGLIMTAFVIGLSGAMAPGSLLVVVITETMKHGFWAGPTAILGHALIELVVVALLSLGLGAYLAMDSVLGAIGFAGGLTLFYFAYGTWRSAKTASIAQESSRIQRSADGAAQTAGRPQTKGARRWNTAASGIAASISNPYWIIWWATIGAAYVATGTQLGPLGPAIFYVGHIASDFTWYALVSWAVATGKRFINDKIYRTVLYACSVLIVLFGAYFLRLGVRLMLGG